MQQNRRASGLEKNMTGLPDIILYRERIPWSQSERHLGHVLTSDLSETADIRDKLSCFYGQTNYFTAKFNCVTPDVRTKLFTCYFSLSTGLSCDDGYLEKISVAWRRRSCSSGTCRIELTATYFHACLTGLLLKMPFYCGLSILLIHVRFTDIIWPVLIYGHNLVRSDLRT